MYEMVLDVYECISCSGLPVVGEPVCYFEAGIISSLMEKLYGKNTIEEVKC